MRHRAASQTTINTPLRLLVHEAVETFRNDDLSIVQQDFFFPTHRVADGASDAIDDAYPVGRTIPQGDFLRGMIV